MAKNRNIPIWTNKNITTGKSNDPLNGGQFDVEKDPGYRPLYQHALSPGSNIYGFDLTPDNFLDFINRHPWLQEYMMQKYGKGFNPEDPAMVGDFQKEYTRRAREFANKYNIPGYKDYFNNNGRQGEGFDSKFGLHTFNAPSFKTWQSNIEPPTFQPEPNTIDYPIDDSVKPYEPPKVVEQSIPDKNPPQLERPPMELPQQMPEVNYQPETPPGPSSQVQGEDGGMGLASLLGAGGLAYLSDYGDKWKMYRGKFGEEALNKAVGYRSDAEIKRQQDLYDTDKQLRDIDLAQQGALLTAQRANVANKLGGTGDVSGNLGTGASLAAAYGAISPYIQQKNEIQQQALSRDAQNLDRIQSINDQIARTEYDITDFRDESKNIPAMIEQGLTTMNKIRNIRKKNPATIYENQVEGMKWGNM